MKPNGNFGLNGFKTSTHNSLQQYCYHRQIPLQNMVTRYYDIRKNYYGGKIDLQEIFDFFNKFNRPVSEIH